MGLVHVFGNKPVPKILDFLRVHRYWDYPLSEIEETTGVSYRTLQVVIPELVRLAIVKETRTVGNAKLYQINFKSPAVQKLNAFALECDLEFAEKQSSVRLKTPALA